MEDSKKKRSVSKAATFLAQYETALIKELGQAAFELLSPRQVAVELAISVPRITDLVRQGWLEAASGQDVGHAHQYYRWRVEFVKRYKRTYQKEKNNEISLEKDTI